MAGALKDRSAFLKSQEEAGHAFEYFKAISSDDSGTETHLINIDALLNRIVVEKEKPVVQLRICILWMFRPEDFASQIHSLSYEQPCFDELSFDNA